MNPEQRKFHRLDTHILIDVGEDHAAVQQDVEALCIDLSSGGMKVLLPMELQVGQVVIVTCLLPKRGRGDFFLETQANVRWCGGEKGSETFAVGLEFEFLPEEAENEIARITERGLFH